MRRLWPLMLLLLGCDAITDFSPPDVRIVQPHWGQELFGRVKVVVEVKDNRVVDRVELYLDGRLVGSRKVGESNAEVEFEVEADYGSHKLRARAYDGGGNWGEVKYSSPCPLPVFVFVPGGEFQMGDLWGDGDSDERPVHTVRVDDFYISRYEITVGQFRMFCEATGRSMPSQPSWNRGDDYPVVNVSWYDAVRFCNWLSRQAGLEEVYDESTWEADFSRVGYRLPTEAEWEYAARGGLTGKKYPNGDTMNDTIANLAKRFRGTTPVGQFEPNGYGLYDMAGNLFEWTADFYSSYSEEEQTDPRGPSSGDYIVIRGGSWISSAAALRVSFRIDEDPVRCGYIGFRVAE